MKEINGWLEGWISTTTTATPPLKCSPNLACMVVAMHNQLNAAARHRSLIKYWSFTNTWLARGTHGFTTCTSPNCNLGSTLPSLKLKVRVRALDNPVTTYCALLHYTTTSSTQLEHRAYLSAHLGLSVLYIYIRLRLSASPCPQ